MAISAAGTVEHNGFKLQPYPHGAGFKVRGRRIDGQHFAVPDADVITGKMKREHLTDHFDTLEFQLADEAIAEGKKIADACVVK